MSCLVHSPTTQYYSWALFSSRGSCHFRRTMWHATLLPPALVADVAGVKDTGRTSESKRKKDKIPQALRYHACTGDRRDGDTTCCVLSQKNKDAASYHRLPQNKQVNGILWLNFYISFSSSLSVCEWKVENNWFTFVATVSPKLPQHLRFSQHSSFGSSHYPRNLRHKYDSVSAPSHCSFLPLLVPQRLVHYWLASKTSKRRARQLSATPLPTLFLLKLDSTVPTQYINCYCISMAVKLCSHLVDVLAHRA